MLPISVARTPVTSPAWVDDSILSCCRSCRSQKEVFDSRLLLRLRFAVRVHWAAAHVDVAVLGGSLGPIEADPNATFASRTLPGHSDCPTAPRSRFGSSPALNFTSKPRLCCQALPGRGDLRVRGHLHFTNSKPSRSSRSSANSCP